MTVISHKAITDSDIELDDDVVYFVLNIELKDKINDIKVQELYATEFLTPFNFFGITKLIYEDISCVSQYWDLMATIDFLKF